MPETVDVAVRGGDAVLGSGAVRRVDLGITAGRIAQIGGAVRGRREVDARGCLILPGGVDPHVHLSPVEGEDGPAPWADDFATGTRAAARGGVTTVGNITFPRPGELLSSAVRRVGAEADGVAHVDVFLHAVVSSAAQRDPADLAVLERLGQTSIKVFSTLEDFSLHRSDYYAFLREAAARGFMSLLHCEDQSIIDSCIDELENRGLGNFRHYGESRPDVAEESAVRQFAAFSEIAGVPAYVVHLSSARALDACTDARRRGAPLFVETRPLYLHLTAERLQEDDGAKYIGQPPLRTTRDRDALWAGLAQGTVDVVGTDHAPYTLAQKLAAGSSLTDLRAGVADLETLRPMLFSEGVLGGRISLQRFVDVTATNPAKLFGLFPRKGVIAPGSDADLVLWDAEEERVVDGSQFESRAGYSPYDGWTVRGWPRATLLRGEVVASSDGLFGPSGLGQVVQRGRTQTL